MAIVSSSAATASSISFNPLEDDMNKSALKTFVHIVRTCIGPYGKLKVVQNVAGGHVTVTSSSQRLFHNVSVKNTLLKFIIASAKTQLKYFGDGGLFSTLLILKLIENSISLTYPLPLAGKLYEYFGKIFIECLNSEKNLSVTNLDLGNLSNLQCVISSLLQSKPGCLLTEDDKRHLSVLILKVVLNAIPTSKLDYCFSFNVLTLEGICARESKLYNGLLVRNTEITENILLYLKNKEDLKIVIFATSLSGDAEFPVETVEVSNNISLWEVVLKFLQNIVAKVISEKVNIVACQKVVHPKLRKQLEDANILVLDRLGSDVTKYLEYVSGSSAVSSLASKITYGSLTNIKEEKVGINNFLLLFNKIKPFWTLLICNYNEEALNETKVVCRQAVDTLFRLFKKPKVCFGGGCSEVHTCKLLDQKVKERLNEIKKEINCSVIQIQETLKVFLQSIMEVALAFHQGSILDFVTDTGYGHLWKLNDGNYPVGNATCMCGQYLAKSVDCSTWSFLKSLNEFSFVSDMVTKEAPEINKSVILDEYSSKVNGYAVAFDTASLLLRVSLCISSAT